MAQSLAGEFLTRSQAGRRVARVRSGGTRRVYGGVDDDMVARTVTWLRARRDGKGGYQRNARALDSFGRASPEVTNAYITYSLTEAG